MSLKEKNLSFCLVQTLLLGNDQLFYWHLKLSSHHTYVLLREEENSQYRGMILFWIFTGLTTDIASAVF